MANFKLAESITGRNEGGYANNPADSGGETYAGIARNYWPQWKGWRIIDSYKTGKWNAATINKKAASDTVLHGLISNFYKANFWDVNKLDQFADQQIANTVYDFGVNSGTGRAAKMLQEVLNVAQDGVVGQKTLNTLNMGNAKAVHTAYNCRRKAFYETIAKKPGQAQFLKSWLSRLKPYV